MSRRITTQRAAREPAPAAPYAPPDAGLEHYDDDALPKRGVWLLLVSLMVMVGFAFVVWQAYQSGLREGGRAAPPVIAASEVAMKTRPDNPGGFVAPDQDKTVFDRWETPAAADDPVTAPDALAPVVDTGPARPRQKPAPPPLQVAVQGGESVVRPAEGPSLITPVNDDGTPVEAPPAEAQPVVPVAPQEPGDYVVQLASLPTSDRAATERSTVYERHRDLWREQDLEIMVVDLGDRGVRHRLVAPGFTDRAQAAAFCETLKTRNQACLVVKQ